MTTGTISRQPEQLLEYARRYHALGWVLTRVQHGGKRPIDDGWQTATPPTAAAVEEWFSRGRFNIGLRTGAVSGGIVDLDIDAEALVPYVNALAPAWLRDCPRYARGDRPHLLLRPDPLPPYRKYAVAGHTLVEVRGDGHQSVLPPSLHPSGAQYRWLVEPHQPPVVPLWEMDTFIENVLFAYALGLGWKRGVRQDVVLAAAGWLGRRGLAEERVQQVIEAAARCAADEEIAKRLDAISGTIAKVRVEQPATGWPTLQRLLPLDAVRLLADLFPRGEQSAEREERVGPYVARDGAIYVRIPPRRADAEGTEQQLANFDARIVRQEVLVDGSGDLPRLLVIEGHHASGRRLPPARVAAAEFAGLNWVLSAFGTDAVISAGSAVRDKLREAIQRFSGTVSETRVYQHTGFVRLADGWGFLHAGGVIGSCLPVAVELSGALARYRLPATVADGREGVRRTLALFELSPEPAISVLWCAVYLAPLASILQPDLTVWLWGRTGSFKSTLAALLLSHFGAFDRKTLPADWSSTDNMLERLAFLAKDVPLVIDEFAPAGTRQEQQKLVVKASRLIRAQGNLSGRGRMRADTSLRPAMPPRGLIIATAEMPPPLPESALARTVLVELARGGINRAALTEAQTQTADLAEAMALYLGWVAKHYDELQETLPEAFRHARQAHQEAGHLRVPEVLANLEVGAATALTAFGDLGLADTAIVGDVMGRIRRDLHTIGCQQRGQVAQARPGLRFVGVLRELFAKKAAYLVSRSGDVPFLAEELGWQLSATTAEQGADATVVPGRGGSRLGWADEEWLYLLPAVAYREVTRFLNDADQVLGASEDALHRDLEDLRLIDVRAAHDGTRRTVPIMLEGKQQRVLKLRRSALQVEDDDV